MSKLKKVVKAFIEEKKYIKAFVEKAESITYAIVSPFIYIYFVRYYLKKIRLLNHNDQLFILARGDFGYIIMFFNYINLWQKQRGQTYLVMLSSCPFADDLARLICPDTKIINYGSIGKIVLKIFRNMSFQLNTLSRVQGVIQLERPDALSLYMNPITIKLLPRTQYISHFDENLSVYQDKLSKPFVNAYVRFRTYCQIDQALHADYIRLQNSCKPMEPNQITLDKFNLLKEKLKIEDPFVVMNINCKTYGPSQQRRSIQHFERYNELIDYFIDNKISIVIQGRNEQPNFGPRKNLIDYSRSNFCSMEHDFSLYHQCLFSVVSKSGPDSFNAVFDKPYLELNSVEFCYCRPNLRGRYFFKHVYSRKIKDFVPWQKIFTTPIFFDSSDLAFDPDIEYIEMSAQEIVKAGEEFLSLIQGKSDWMKFSKEQIAFKNMLTALHVDHYHVKSVPSDTYLKICSYGNPV